MCLNDIHVLELDKVTDGQATSAYLSRELWRNDGALLIYKIGTYVKPDYPKPSDIHFESDERVPCFQVLGDHWSFVKLDKGGWAVGSAEERRILEFVSIGLYWFADAGRYAQIYDHYFFGTDSLVCGERYMTPLYRQLPAEGGKISISDLALDVVHVLGTAAELDAFLSLTPAALVCSRD